MDCSKLTSGLVAAICDTAPISGVRGRVVLINYNDIDRIQTTVESNVITSLILKAQAKGFVFESLDDSTLPEVALAKGKYFSQWDHNLTLRIFTKSEAAKKFLESCKLAKIVAIVENKDGGANGEVKYEAYGFDSGLELNECTYSGEYQDNTVYLAKFGTDEISKEGTLPKSVYKTDASATETMINGLVA